MSKYGCSIKIHSGEISYEILCSKHTLARYKVSQNSPKSASKGSVDLYAFSSSFSKNSFPYSHTSLLSSLTPTSPKQDIYCNGFPRRPTSPPYLFPELPPPQLAFYRFQEEQSHQFPITQNRTALHCTALHCTALHCTAQHCSIVQRCVHQWVNQWLLGDRTGSGGNT